MAPKKLSVKLHKNKKQSKPQRQQARQPAQPQADQATQSSQPAAPQVNPATRPEDDQSLFDYVGADLAQHGPQRAFALKALRHHAERCGLQDHVYEVLNLRQLLDLKLRPTLTIEYFIFDNLVTDEMLRKAFAFICHVLKELRAEFDRHTHNHRANTAQLTNVFFHALQRSIDVDSSRLFQALDKIQEPENCSINDIRKHINDDGMRGAWIALEEALQEIYPTERKFCEVERLVGLPPSGASDSLRAQRWLLEQEDDTEAGVDRDRLRRLAHFLLSHRHEPQRQQYFVTQVQPLLSQDMVNEKGIACQFVQLINEQLPSIGTLVDRASSEARPPWQQLKHACMDLPTGADESPRAKKAMRKLNRRVLTHKAAIVKAQSLLSKIIPTEPDLPPDHESELNEWTQRLKHKSGCPPLEEDDLPDDSDQFATDEGQDQTCDASTLMRLTERTVKVRDWRNPVVVRLLNISAGKRLHLAQADEHNRSCTLTAAPLDKDIEPWLTADEVIRHPQLSRVFGEIGNERFSFQVSSQQLSQPARQSAGFVLHGPPYHAPHLCYDDALVLGAVVKAPSGYAGEIERAVARLNELNESSLGAFMLFPTVTLAASALLTTCATGSNAEQSPLTVDFCPPCLRLAASDAVRTAIGGAAASRQLPDNADSALLLQAYWRDRLKLPEMSTATLTETQTEDTGGAGDYSTKAQVAQVLSMALSDERLQTGRSIGLVPTRQFTQVAQYCQEGGLSFEIWRPVIYAFRVSRLNLTTVRTRMFRLQSSQTLTLVFLTFTERIPIADISRLLLPFTNRLSVVRILLDQNDTVVRDLSASPVAAHLYSLYGDTDATIERPRHCSFEDFEESVPAASLRLTRDEGLSGFDLERLLQEDAQNAQGWNLHVRDDITEALQGLSNSGSGSDGHNLDASTTGGQTHAREPASSFHLHLMAHVDAGVLKYLRMAHLQDTARPFDSASPTFYRDLDAALDPRKDLSKTRGACIVITSADLLSVTEKRALRERLEAAQRSALFLSTSLDPADAEIFQSCARTTSIHDLTRCVPSALLLLPWLEQRWQQQSFGLPADAQTQEARDSANTGPSGSPPRQQHGLASESSDTSNAQALCVLLQLLLGTTFSAVHIQTRGHPSASALVDSLRRSGPPTGSCSVQDWTSCLNLLLDLHRTAKGQVMAATGVHWLDSLYDAIYSAVGHSEISSLLAWPSFEQFVATSAAVQLLPRGDRLQRWLIATLSFFMGTNLPQQADTTWKHQLKATVVPMEGSCIVLPRRPPSTRQYPSTGTAITGLGVYDYFARDLQSSSHTEELLLRSAQRLEELDWKYLTTVWGELAISLSSLVRLLRCCSRPLHLILTIGPQILDAFLQGASEQQRAELRGIFGLVPAHQAHTLTAKSLPAIIQHLCASRDTKFASLAVLVFHLVGGHDDTSAQARVAEDHIHLMLAAGLHFKVTGVQDAETLLRSLCSVDSPSTLFVAQQGLVRAITNLVDVENLNTILSATHTIGAALVAGVLHLLDAKTREVSSASSKGGDPPDGAERQVERQENVEQARCNILETRLGYALENVCRDSALLGDTQVEQCREQMDKLSGAAWALVLRRRTPDNTEALVNLMHRVLGNQKLNTLRACLCNAEKPLSLEAALEILLHLKQRDPSLLEQPISKTDSDAEQAGLFDLLCEALRAPDSFSWENWVRLECPKLPLHFRGMGAVRSSLARWLAAQIASEQDKHQARLKIANRYLREFDGPALKSLLVHAEECVQDTPLQPDLYILLWVLRPVRRFVLNLERSDGDAGTSVWELVYKLAEALNLKHRLKDVMVPPLLATYLTCPERLPLAVFLSFERSAVQFSRRTVSPDTFVVGQSTRNSSHGPGQERPLSVNLYGQKVDGRCMFRRLSGNVKVDSLPKPESISSLVFVVDSGCNEDIMLLNLRAFIHLCSKSRRVGMHDPTRENSDACVAANRQYVANLILLWFQALGVSPEAVRTCARSVLGTSDFCFEPPIEGRGSEYMAEPSLIAPPGVIDVHMRGTDSLLEPFGDKAEDKEFTLRYIRLFAPPSSAYNARDERVESFAHRAARHFGCEFAENADHQQEGVRVFMLALQTFFRAGDRGGQARPRTCARKMLRECIDGIAESLPSPASDAPARFFRWAVRSVGFSEDATQCDREDPTKEDTTNKQLVLQVMEEYVRRTLCVCTATYFEINFCVDNGMYRPTDQLWAKFKELKRRDVDTFTQGRPDRAEAHPLCYINEPGGPVSTSTHLRTLTSHLAQVRVTQHNESLATCPQPRSEPEDIHSGMPVQTAFFQEAREREHTSRKEAQGLQTQYSAGIEGLEGPVSLSFPQMEPVVVRLQDVICLQNCFDDSDPSFGAYSMCVRHGQGGVLCMQRIPDGEEATRQRLLATLVFFSRDALAEGRVKNIEKHFHILQTFPTHEAVWQQVVRCAPPGSLIIGDGIILVRDATTRRFEPLFLQPEERLSLGKRLLLMHNLQDYGLVQEVARILRGLTVLAFAQHSPSPHEFWQGLLKAGAPDHAFNEPDDSFIDFLFEKLAKAAIGRGTGAAASSPLNLDDDISNVSVEEKFRKWHQSFCAPLQESAEDVADFKQAMEELKEGVPDGCENLFNALLQGLLKARMDVQKSEVYRATVTTQSTLEACLDVPSFLEDCGSGLGGPWGQARESNSDPSASSEGGNANETQKREQRAGEEGAAQFPSVPQSVQCSDDAPAVRIPSQDTTAPYRFVELEKGSTRGQYTRQAYILSWTPAPSNHCADDEQEQALSQDLIVWLTKVMSARLSPQLHRWFVRMVLTRTLCLPPQVDPNTNVSCYLTCFSLADTCPDTGHRATLLSAFPLPDPLPMYFGHVSEVYGVYVVHPRVLHILRDRHRVPLKVIDKLELQARGIVTKDHIYSTIVQQFVDGVVLVYVRGFSTIEDLLLKWCAEYTKAKPYHYIFFEQLDTSRNFSENRDRCNLQLYRPLTLEELQVLGSTAAADESKAVAAGLPPASLQSRVPLASDVDASSAAAGTPRSSSTSQQQARAQQRLSSRLRSRRKKQRAARRTAARTATKSIEKVEYKASRKLWDVPSLDTVAAMPPNQQTTAVSGDWKYEIREWLKPSANNEEARALTASSAALRAFVIFSPPGAGKTRFMEKTIMPLAQAEGFERQYFDCSNSRLIEENLTSLLEEVCANRSDKTFLVVDEFHMLTWAQKKEIFNYLLARDQTLYTVLIGNRKEKEDDDLLDRWKRQKADVRSMICRLPIKHLGMLLQQEHKTTATDRSLHALCWWYAACRALFSDDVLTYRNRTQVWDTMRAGGSSRDLGSILSKKAPFLGPLTCERVSHFTMQFFNQVWRSTANPHQMLEKLLSEEDGDPFSLLVRTGLASYLLTLLRGHRQRIHMAFASDGVSEGRIQGLEPDEHVLLSFPEYCRQLKESHCIPPAVRLALWCRFVFSNCVTELGGSGTSDSIDSPSVGALQMLCMIDQPTFPLITELAAEPQPLGEGRAFSETGDYTDLEWIRVSLQKNAAISWARAKRVWRNHFVSDIEGVTRLLNEAPDPFSVLSALDPANLCALMRAKRSAKSGRDLCAAVICVALRQLASTGGGSGDGRKTMPPGGNADAAAIPEANDHTTPTVLDTNDSQNPVCLAAWLAFDSFDEVTKILIDEVAPPAEPQRRLIGRQVKRLRRSALVWASTYSSTEPAARGSVMAATQKLKQCLMGASEAILEANRPSAARELNQLWSRRFAPLMPRREKELQDLRAAVFLLAGNHFPCHEDWPPLFMRIGKVMNEIATADDVLRLSQSPFFVRPGSTFYELSWLSPGQAGYSEEQRFIKGLLSPRLQFHLPINIQQALLVTAAAAKCMPTEMLGVEYLHQKFAHALICLEDSRFIQAGSLQGELRKRYYLVHGAASVLERKQVLKRAQGRQNRQAMERLKKDMQHMHKYLSVDDPNILRYYNRCLGVQSLEESSNSKVEVDEYKNPRGGQFDLAVDGAFSGHSVLIGNFFKAQSAFLRCILIQQATQHKQVAELLGLKRHQWRTHQRQFYVRGDMAENLGDRSDLIASVGNSDSGDQVMLPELPESILRENIQEFMQRKGFDFDIEASERAFARKLRTGRYSVAWVISGAAEDAYDDASGSLDSWQEGVLDVAQTCHSFHQQGGGLLVFGENDPFHVHANAVLRMLGSDLDLRGNISGSNYVVRRKFYSGNEDDSVLSKASNGQMVDRHPITTGLVTLFEGVTICHPHSRVSQDWKAVVRGGFSKNDSERPVPVVLAHDGAPGGHGRVVVDTGFTKLWVNWNEGGTDRYVMNATSWLVGKDLELRAQTRAGQMQSVPGSFRSVGADGVKPWLAQQVSQAAPPAVDLICIVDLSGSMKSFFSQLRSFLQDMVDMFQIGRRGSRNRMAIIGFGSHARVDTWLTNDVSSLRHCIAQLNCRGGTLFQPPLQEALQRLQADAQQGSRRRVLMFQTDGVNGDRGPGIGCLSKQIVDDFQTTSYAIVVGDLGARERVRDIAGPAGRYDSEDRSPGADSDYILFINDYDMLRREAKNIAQKLNSAS